MTNCKHSALTFLSDQLCSLGIRDKKWIYSEQLLWTMQFAEYSQHIRQIFAQRQLFRKGIVDLIHVYKYRGKQWGPRSDCSYRSSMIWVHTVSWRGFQNISTDNKADNFWCNWQLSLPFMTKVICFVVCFCHLESIANIVSPDRSSLIPIQVKLNLFLKTSLADCIFSWWRLLLCINNVN